MQQVSHISWYKKILERAEFCTSKDGQRFTKLQKAAFTNCENLPQ